MNYLNPNRLKSIIWLAVIGSWALGMIVARWFETSTIFLELSKAVRVPFPLEVGVWWKIIIYFTLTTVSVFALSHIFFGVGGAIFLFARGMYDNSLIFYLETTIGGWSISNIPMSEVWMVLLVILILTVNLPLCLWAGQLGTQRSLYTLNRLRGKPVDPELGSEPLSNLLIILSSSLITGLIAAVVISYI